MGHSFAPDTPRLILPVVVTGPRRGHEFRMTLDTGAERTVLPVLLLRGLGCDFSHPVGHTRLRTVTGTALAPLVRVPAISALGRVRTDFHIAAYDFPLGVQTDGLLGLDFFRGFVLTLDFARGRMSLTRRRWWQFWR